MYDSVSRSCVNSLASTCRSYVGLYQFLNSEFRPQARTSRLYLLTRWYLGSVHLKFNIWATCIYDSVSRSRALASRSHVCKLLNSDYKLYKLTYVSRSCTSASISMSHSHTYLILCLGHIAYKWHLGHKYANLCI